MWWKLSFCATNDCLAFAIVSLATESFVRRFFTCGPTSSTSAAPSAATAARASDRSLMPGNRTDGCAGAASASPASSNEGSKALPTGLTTRSAPPPPPPAASRAASSPSTRCRLCSTTTGVPSKFDNSARRPRPGGVAAMAEPETPEAKRPEESVRNNSAAASVPPPPSGEAMVPACTAAPFNSSMPSRMAFATWNNCGPVTCVSSGNLAIAELPLPEPVRCEKNASLASLARCKCASLACVADSN